MCGRYKRKSDKQRIAEVFHVAAGLDELPDEPGDDLRPQSLQPVIFTNDQGERQIELMRWAFKLPDKLLFNARSEGIDHAKFWKDAFLTGRCIVPGDALYEWQETEKGKKKPKYEFTYELGICAVSMWVMQLRHPFLQSDESNQLFWNRCDMSVETMQDLLID